MRKMLLAASAFLAALLVGIVVAGAGEGSVKKLFGIEPLPQKTHLRIAFFSGSLHGLPNYIAQEKGWFEAANLEIEMVPFVNGPAIMEAKRSWDVGTTGAPGMISGIVGHDVRMIALSCWDNLLHLFVREDNPIYKSGKGHIPGYPEIWGKPEDWKGTQWLLPAGTTMHLVILTTLERMGLSDKDVKINSMEATSAYTAFKAGQGDGLGVWLTLAAMAAQNGYKIVGGIQECGAKLTTAIYANDDALKEKRAAVKKYLEVFLATAKWMTANEAEAVDLYVQTCEEEGVAVSPEVAKITIDSAATPTLAEQVAFVENKIADPKDAARKISEMEKLIIDTFDFFASQGRYKPEDRQKILGGYIDPSVLFEIKADYEKAGKKID